MSTAAPSPNAPGSLAETAQTVARTLRAEVPTAMRWDAARIRAGQRVRGVVEPAAGARGDHLRSASDLVEAAVWFALAGDKDGMGEALVAAREHQRTHLELLDRALARPSSRAARRLWEANHLSAEAHHERARQGLRGEADRVCRVIRALETCPETVTGGESWRPARRQRRRLAAERILANQLRDALIGGRFDDARALVGGLALYEDDDARASRLLGAREDNLVAAAALARAEPIEAQMAAAGIRLGPPLPASEIHGRFDDLDRIDASTIALARGGRAPAPPPPAKTALALRCGHLRAAWQMSVVMDGRPDALALVCPECESRIALVPAHRVPAEGGHGAPVARLLSAVGDDPTAYLLWERRERALCGEPDPGPQVSFEALRRLEGVVSLDPAAHRASFTAARLVRPRSLREAFGSR